jgi:predicted ferric reductase
VNNDRTHFALAVNRYRQAIEFVPPSVIPSRFAGKSWGIFLMMVYPILLVTPLAIFAVLRPPSEQALAAEVGVDCAVVGFTILALQFVLMARLRWIEAPFGLDVLLAFHRAMALLALALLCTHPLLIASSEGWSLLTRLNARWYIWAGRAALALLLLQVAVSLGRRAIRLPYERWRRLHNVFALTILSLGFAHSLSVGDDGAGPIVWTATMAVALGAWLYSRVIRPWLLLCRSYRVAAIEPEGPNVWTLTLRSERDRPLQFAPGQFVFLRLHGTTLASEEHPFTIASSPTCAGRISLTVKESGDFTSMISGIRPGDRATLHGPFGRFSHTLHADADELVFVAAGVGITPLISMLRHMRTCRKPQPVLLVYANKCPADVLFREELSAMEAHATPMLKVIHILSRAPRAWTRETGRLDADRLVRLCGGIHGKAFYICCPQQMTAELVRGLRRIGVDPGCIHADYFSL